MLRPLADLSTVSKRMVLLCYARVHAPGRYRAIAAHLAAHRTWAPTPDDCPVDWDALAQWYAALERTGQMVMDSY
jgi:hypothetical protein